MTIFFSENQNEASPSHFQHNGGDTQLVLCIGLGSRHGTVSSLTSHLKRKEFLRLDPVKINEFYRKETRFRASIL